MVPGDIVGRAPRLKWLQLTSAGVDRLLDAPIVHSSGAMVTTASGITPCPSAQYVIGAMLAFGKSFPRAEITGRAAGTCRRELEGKTVGILGIGAIGSRVADIAHALGMGARGPAVPSAPGRKATAAWPSSCRPRSCHTSSASDYVIVAVPLTDESRRMIGETELRLMKPTAVLVNIARGAVIDEAALIRALKEGWIASAALDVFEQEPLPAERDLEAAERPAHPAH